MSSATPRVPLSAELRSAEDAHDEPLTTSDRVRKPIHYRTSRAFSSQGRIPERTPSHLRCAMSFAISPGYTNTTVGRRAASLLGSASSCEAITTSAVERSERSTAAHAGVAQTRGGPDLAAAADENEASRSRREGPPPGLLRFVLSGSAVRRVAGPPSAVVGCTKRTIRRSGAISTSRSTRLSHRDRAGLRLTGPGARSFDDRRRIASRGTIGQEDRRNARAARPQISAWTIDATAILTRLRELPSPVEANGASR